MAPDQVPLNNFPNTLANCAIRQYARGMTTSPEISPRDELAEIIEREEHYYDTGSYYELSAEKAAAAILAAGYRKPRTITTVEEAEALPVGTVIRCCDDGELAELDTFRAVPTVGPKPVAHWRSMGAGFSHLSQMIIPATVLWEPEA